MNPELVRQPYTLVVGLDYSELSRLVLKEAVFLASSQERSHIHLLHAAPTANAAAGLLSTADPSMASGAASAALALEMSNNMQRYVEHVLVELAENSSITGIRWTTHLRHSEPARALAQLASDAEADLILVGTHGRRGLARFLLGSVAEAVVRLAPCPVLVVRPRGAQSAEEVKIEPPCPECVAVRRANDGKVFWCERHSQRHDRAHTYHFTPFRDSHQSGMLLHPLD